MKHDDTRDARLRRMLDELTDGHAPALDPEDEWLYGLVFDALAEDPYPPLSGLAAAVEARLGEEGRAARPAILELAGTAVLVLAGVVAVPAVTTPLATLLHAVSRHWASANLDLLLVSSIAGVLLVLVDRAVLTRRSPWRRHSGPTRPG